MLQRLWLKIYQLMRSRLPLVRQPSVPLASFQASNPLTSSVPYLLPHTAAELERLYFQHRLLYKAWQDRYFLVTLYNPHFILDAGSGSNQWVYDVAQQFPETTVVGIDIVLPKRMNAEVRNVVFRRHDLLQHDLPFQTNYFDFVHMRFMSSSLPVSTWAAVIGKLWQMTTPGGWLQWTEPGKLSNAGPGISTLWKAWRILGEKRGMNVQPGEQIYASFTAQPLLHVQTYTTFIPVGKHHQHLGLLSGKDGLALARTLQPLIVAEQIMNADDFDVALRQAAIELDDAASLCTWSIYSVVGQRPFTQ